MKKALKFAIVLSIVFTLLSGNVAVLAVDIINTIQEQTEEKSQSNEIANDVQSEANDDEAIPTDKDETVGMQEPNSTETSNTTATQEAEKQDDEESAKQDNIGYFEQNLILNDQEVSPIAETVSTETGKICIIVNLRFPNGDENLHKKLTVKVKNNDTGKTFEPLATGMSKDSATLYYTIENLKPATKNYKLEITGNGYKYFSQDNIEVKANMITELRYTNGYDSKNLSFDNENNQTSIIGVIGLGDIDSNGQIDSEDEKTVLAKIQLGSKDLKYDLNGDSKVNIIDLSYICINEETGHQNKFFGARESFMADITVKQEDLKISEDTEVTGNLQDILKNNDKFVTLKPANENAEISIENPVQIELNMKENTTETAMITIAPSLNVENNIESGEATIIGEDENGVIKEIKVQIGEQKQNVSTQGAIKLYKLANKNNAKSDFSTIDNELQPTETVSGKAEISTNGTIEINLNGKVAVKKVTIKVTGTKSKKLADIAKVEFLNNMSDKIPEPALDIPDGVIVEQPSEEKVTMTWNNKLNVTGYEVKVSGKVKGKDVVEYHSAQGNMLTLEQFGGEGIKDLVGTEEGGTKITVEVCSVNGEWKSKYSDAKTVTLLTHKEPPRPEYVTAKGAYREIQLTWRDNTKTDSYDVYYRIYETGEYKHANKNTVIPGTATSYTISGLEATQYRYQIYVTATNQFGTSEPSTVVVAETTIVQPAQLPKYKMINAPVTDEQGNEIEGRVTSHIKAATYNKDKDTSMIGSTVDAENTNSALGAVDNSYASYWQKTDWDDGGTYGDDDGNKGITVEFDQAYEMSYFTYAQVENLGTIDQATIYYWDETGIHKVKPYSITTKRDDKGRDYTVIKLSEKIKTSKVNVQIGRTYGYTRKLTIAEMRFYNYDSLEHDINGLYSDQLHVTLRDDVTIETINDLQKRIDTPDEVSGEYHPDRKALQNELDLAKEILNEGAKLKPAIKIDTTVTKSKDGHIEFTGGLNAWQPLGLVSYRGENIKIYVGNPDKKNGDTTNLQLVTAQYFPEASTWKSNTVALKVGLNEITVPEVPGFSLDVETGGSLYIEYTGNNANEIYGVRVVGGEEIPMLDLTKDSNGNDYKDETARKAAVKTYVESLETRVNNLESLHNEKHANSGIAELEHKMYDESTGDKEDTCLLGATEIVLDQMMYSVSGVRILKGLGEGTTQEKADKLYNSLVAMEDMVDLFYSHKGLSKDPEAGEKNQYPVSRLNIRYHRMFTGAAMYAGGLHIGIKGSDVETLSKGNPIVTTAEGKYVSGNYFGWGISHEIGHIINQQAYVHGEVTNNYYSVLSQADDTNGTVRFKYPEVYKKVTSGTIGKAQNVFTQLGLYWQLHLAYDNKGGYNFKMYDTYEEQMANLIVARMDTYARDTSKAPTLENGVKLEVNSNTDNNLMRLACAATKTNLLEFFRKWGMIPDEGTIAYASQWPEETRAIWYINDNARAYQLAKLPEMTKETKVNASREAIVDNEGNATNQVKLTLGTTNQVKDAILGYEVIRNYWKNDQVVSEPVAFVTADDAEKDADGKITYIDTIETINNRVFTYKVVAYDKYLNATEQTTLEPIKISHKGIIGGKEDWEISTNLIAEGEENTGAVVAPKDNMCNEPKEEKAIDVLLKNTNTTDYVGSAPKGQNGEITIYLPDVKKLVGLEYQSQAGKPIKEYEVQISTDGTTWTTVCSGKDSEIEKTSLFTKIFSLFSNDKEPITKTLYFNAQGDSSLYMYDYDASYVKLIIKDSDVSISTIDLIGQTGDNVTFKENKETQTSEAVGILTQDFTYASGKDTDGNEYVIPKDSIVFVGDYKGNPAYNVVKLWYKNSKEDPELKDTDGYDLVEGTQIILAPDPQSENLGETADGTWIYWVEKQIKDEKGNLVNNPVYDQLIKDLGKGKVRAELYRVDDAMTLENERLVSDTLPIELPKELPGMTLSGVTIY